MTRSGPKLNGIPCKDSFTTDRESMRSEIGLQFGKQGEAFE